MADDQNKPRAVAFPPTLIPHVLDYFDRINRPMLPMGMGGLGIGDQGQFGLPQNRPAYGLPQAVLDGQAGGIPPGAPVPPDILNQAPRSFFPATKNCPPFQVVFTPVPNDAANEAGALKNPPLPGSVAINPTAFGVPYGTPGEERRAKATMNDPNFGMTISAPSLAPKLQGGDYMGDGSTTFPVGDVGDRHIRNNPIPQFDIYRWDASTPQTRKEFGVQPSIATAQNVPFWWKCPPPVRSST